MKRVLFFLALFFLAAGRCFWRPTRPRCCVLIWRGSRCSRSRLTAPRPPHCKRRSKSWLRNSARGIPS